MNEQSSPATKADIDALRKAIGEDIAALRLDLEKLRKLTVACFAKMDGAKEALTAAMVQNRSDIERLQIASSEWTTSPIDLSDHPPS